MASPHDSQPASTTVPRQAPGPDEDSSGEVIGDRAAAPAGRPDTRAWALTLAIALAAGLIAWAGGEWEMIPEIASGGRGGAPRVLTDVAATRNAIVSFAILGAALGMGLGLAGGLIRRSVLWTLLAATIGLGLGGLTGFEVSQFSIPYYYAHMKADDLVYSLQVHGGTWAAIGAIAGLAFGFGRGPWRAIPRCLLGAAAGALVATIIYEFAGMMLFPMAMTDRPLSKTSDTRLMARLLVAAMVAAGALLSGSRTAVGPRQAGPEGVVENRQAE